MGNNVSYCWRSICAASHIIKSGSRWLISSAVSPVVRWIKPPFGYLKIHVVGAWCEDSRMGGVGIFIRDDKGSFVAASAIRFRFVFSPLQAEALAAWEGLSLAMERGFNDFLFECDCL